RWFLLDGRLFARRDFGLKLSDYLSRQLAFDCKYIRDIAIVTFRPELAVCPRIDQLSVDAHSTAGTLDCAFQHVRYAQVGRDFAQVALRPGLVLHYRCTANHFQIGDSGKASENFILYAIGEVSILFLVA